ncbi:MAG: hypothetical protein E7647_02070 [Ruminococcaceae bacterium]|nr:hypothetical protein [Oscillospiraceae bacterium]
MKKVVAFLLVLSMLALASCGRDSEIVPDATDTAETTVLDDTTAPPDETTGDGSDKEPTVSLPREYEPVIENYKNIVDMRLSENFQENWYNDVYRGTYEGYYDDLIMGDFDTMIVEMLLPGDNVTSSSYGYVLNDINGDNVPELFWVSADLDNIFAVFTLSGMDVQLLDAFWSRYQCCVTDKGELYTRGSSGAAVTSYHIRALEPHSAELISVKEFGSDTDEAGEQFYYEAESFGADYISEERFEELLSEYPFENGESWKKSFVYSLPNDYYLTEMSEENIVSISVPDVEFDGVISDRVTSYLTEHFFEFECQLEKTDSMSTELLERLDSREYTGYCAELDGTVTRSDEKMISIKFEGLVNYMTAAHPNHVLFSVNVDKATGERVLFADKYNITDELYSVFLTYAQAEIDSVAGEGTVSVEEQLCPKDSFIKGLSDESTVCVFYSGESIVISYEVPFAVGGHREAEIPLSELSQFEK